METLNNIYLPITLITSDSIKNYVPKWRLKFPKSNLIEYADTRTIPYEIRYYPRKMSKYIFNHLIPIKNGERPKGEVWVDFTDKDHTILSLKVNRNKKLIAKRSLLRKENAN